MNTHFRLYSSIAIKVQNVSSLRFHKLQRQYDKYNIWIMLWRTHKIYVGQTKGARSVVKKHAGKLKRRR